MRVSCFLFWRNEYGKILDRVGRSKCKTVEGKEARDDEVGKGLTGL